MQLKHRIETFSEGGKAVFILQFANQGEWIRGGVTEADKSHRGSRQGKTVVL